MKQTRPDEKAHKRAAWNDWQREMENKLLTPAYRKLFGSEVIGGKKKKVSGKGEEKAVIA